MVKGLFDSRDFVQRFQKSSERFHYQVALSDYFKQNYFEAIKKASTRIHKSHQIYDFLYYRLWIEALCEMQDFSGLRSLLGHLQFMAKQGWDDASCWALCGLIHLELGEWEGASFFQKILNNDQENPYAMELKDRLLFRKEVSPKACFLSQYQNTPDYFSWLYRIRRCLMDGDYLFMKKGLTFLRRIYGASSVLDSFSFFAALEKAMSMPKKGASYYRFMAEARSLAQKIYEGNQKDFHAWTQFAGVLWLNEEKEEMQKVLDEAETSFPEEVKNFKAHIFMEPAGEQHKNHLWSLLTPQPLLRSLPPPPTEKFYLHLVSSQTYTRLSRGALEPWVTSLTSLKPGDGLFFLGKVGSSYRLLGRGRVLHQRQWVEPTDILSRGIPVRVKKIENLWIQNPERLFRIHNQEALKLQRSIEKSIKFLSNIKTHPPVFPQVELKSS